MACLLCGDGIDYKRVTCTDCLAKRVAERKRKLQKIRDACQPLRDIIRSHIEENKAVLKQNMVAGLREAKINAIKEVIARARQHLVEDQQKAERLRNKIQTRSSALEEAREKLRKRKTYLASLPSPDITELKRTYEQRALELATLRRSFIAELLAFFPVNPSPTSEKESLIINILLPNDGIYTSYPAETLSAALGYVAHIVYLVSSYLGVTLPYPIDFAGARSAVYTTDETPRRYPLYGTRVSDMEIGTRLINYNIVYLCFTQGVHIKRAMYNCTLPNLMALLRIETLGWPGPRERTSPRAQRQLPPLRIQRFQQVDATTTTDSGNINSTEEEQQLQLVVVKSNKIRGSTGSEDDDFIVLEKTVVPTPLQAEDLAHFERAMFIDTS